MFLIVVQCAVLSRSVVSNSCDPMNCSLPDVSVHGILQARILEWVAMPSSRVSFQPGDATQVSHIAGGFFTIWATREAHWLLLYYYYCYYYYSNFSRDTELCPFFPSCFIAPFVLKIRTVLHVETRKTWNFYRRMQCDSKNQVVFSCTIPEMKVLRPCPFSGVYADVVKGR